MKQKELSEKQLERLQVLDSQGAISPSLVSDLKGQSMNDELTIINSTNQLELPVFNYFRARNNIKLAAITLRQNQIIEDNTKTQLRRDIEQAHLNMTSSYESYKTLLQLVDAYNIAFHAAQIRFQSGVGTSVDYLIAKNNVDRATINLISSKYDFVLRKKILDYYQNIATVK